MQLLTYPRAEQEMLPLIADDGRVVGQATRAYCHGGSMALHPVVHLHVVDSQGRLYLQKRSMRKDIAPGLWDTSVGGHVSYGEDLHSAVQREASEEVGLTFDAHADEASGRLRFLFQYEWQSSSERELVTAYALSHDGPLTPDLDEVDDGRFFTLPEVEQGLREGWFTEQFAAAEWPRLQELHIVR